MGKPLGMESFKRGVRAAALDVVITTFCLKKSFNKLKIVLDAHMFFDVSFSADFLLSVDEKPVEGRPFSEVTILKQRDHHHLSFVNECSPLIVLWFLCNASPHH